MSAQTEQTDVQLQLEQERRRVDVDHFDLTVREVVRMAWSGELHRAPDYQRKFRWDAEREAKLVESLFLGLPVPSIFVATNQDGSWELVDGLQRITTLMHYVEPTPEQLKAIGRDAVLALNGLEKLSLLNGKCFTDLATPLQWAFYKRSIRVTALSDKSDPDVRFDMFERLNSGGIVLTEQEVRSCVYQGKFTTFVKTLAADSDFLSLLKLREGQQDDGTKEELVLKFFAYFYDRASFKDDVKGFLNAYTKAATRSFDEKGAEATFRSAVQHLAALIGGPLLRANWPITPLNQFEGVLVGAADVLAEHGRLGTPPSGWLEDEELLSFSQKGTNTKKMLNGRINRARTLLTPSAKARRPRR